jgi:sodium/hydrogen antiporter
MGTMAAGTSFDVPLLIFGAVLMGGALLSGLAHRSFLSLTVLFVLTGFVPGEGGLEVLEIDAGSGFVAVLATVALVVIPAS